MGFFKWLAPIDQFAHTVGLNYTKSEGHRTLLGISMSLCKLCLLIIYFSHIAVVCIIRKDPVL